MSNADATADLATPPAPPPERCKPVPPRIADLLVVVHVLLVYGRHLALTLEHRSVAWGFSAIAQCFGTARVPDILARISRGLLRLQALQRVLLDRARRGRDLAFLHPRRRATRKPPPATQPPANPQAAASQPQPACRHPPRRRDLDDLPDPANLPTLAQLEAEIRRHPIGDAIAAICLDLGVAPRLCIGQFWNALFETITWYGGNLPKYMKDLRRREVAFEPHLGPTPPLQVPEATRDGILRMLGFFIGEQWPVMPYPVPAPRRLLRANATGPP